MEESLLGYVKRRLHEVGRPQWPEVAKRSGKSLPTINKIAYGDRRNPTLDTIEPIAVALRDLEQRIQ